MIVDFTTGVLALVLIGLGTFIVECAARRALLRGREEKSLEDLYESFVFKIPVDLDTFVQVIRLVGNCYRVEPGKLRADDSFDGLLAQLDSWDLGGGAEDLQERLERDLSVRVPQNSHLSTLQDLIEYCQSSGVLKRGSGIGTRTIPGKSAR
jgi:hypothetical protein